MTGIIDPDFETNHIGANLIQCLKNMKYRVYFTRPEPESIKNHDFIVVWNSAESRLDYMRRNIAFQDLDYVLQHGIGYNYKSEDWQYSEQVKQTLATYIAKADAELAPLEQLRMELLNTYEYPEELRLRLFFGLDKFKKIKKLEKKHMKLDNKRFMDNITESVAEFITYLRMYKTRIQQLIETDTKFVSIIAEKYGAQLGSHVACEKKYIEFESAISLCADYKITNIAIELINSDYNTRFNNNLIKLNELLQSTEYNIYNYYKPDARYAGIIAKYMYNDAYCDTTKYKEGKCYCAKSCITADRKACISVSISIFRPGSIIITAGKDVGQLVRVYNYLNTMFQKHFKTISYVDAHDNRDHFLLNEERKIMRKENLVYIKKTNIIVVPSKPAVVTTAANDADTTSIIAKSKERKPRVKQSPIVTVPPSLKLSSTPKGCDNETFEVVLGCKRILDPTVPNFDVGESPILDLSSLKIAVKITTTRSSSETTEKK
jgi:hypothetical protein